MTAEMSFQTTRVIDKSTPEGKALLAGTGKRLGMKPRPKGKTNNPNGRPAGVPNRLTRELRLALRDALAGHIESIPELLDGLPPDRRLEMLVKLLPYVLPRIESVSPRFGEPGLMDDIQSAVDDAFST